MSLTDTLSKSLAAWNTPPTPNSPSSNVQTSPADAGLPPRSAAGTAECARLLATAYPLWRRQSPSEQRKALLGAAPVPAAVVASLRTQAAHAAALDACGDPLARRAWLHARMVAILDAADTDRYRTDTTHRHAVLLEWCWCNESLTRLYREHPEEMADDV